MSAVLSEDRADLPDRLGWLPAQWRSENAVMLAALVLSVLLLIAFCAVVSGVVRSAEEMHQSSGQPAANQQAEHATDRADQPS